MMKFIVTWTYRPEHRDAVHKRFLEGGGSLPEGVTQIGRWMAAGRNFGVAVYETNDASALARNALNWSDLMDVDVVPALSDHEAGALVAELAAASR
ncbi:MAG: DUF3303 family protein [Burkholderiaceae bacterium]